MKHLELYIHIPFCIKKCNYCDFLSFPSSLETQSLYLESLKRDIVYELKTYDLSKTKVSSIYIGGGTPSILPPEYIREILNTVKNNAPLLYSCEITLEANPKTLSEEKLAIYLEAGINRLSLGFQSSNPKELSYLGRIHSFDDSLESYFMAKKAGFKNINIDLMYAIPGQTLKSFNTTLRRVLMLKPKHLSVYSLIVEQGTKLYYAIHDNITLKHIPPVPSEDEQDLMDELLLNKLTDSGYEHYEISNYSLKGYSCRHNTGYWTGVPYLGFGLGSSSFINHCRYKKTSDLKQYLNNDFSHCDVVNLTTRNEMEEFMFLGLRMTKGISKSEFKNRFGFNINTIYGDIMDKQIKNGFASLEDDRFFLTNRGLTFSNTVMSEYLL